MTVAGSRLHPAEDAHESWPALGTTAVLRLAGPPVPQARAAVQRELDRIDAAASRFRADSELSRLNRAGGRRIGISPLFLEALRLAVRAAAVSDGSVDPTLGQSLIELGYDRDWARLEPASPEGPLDSPPPVSASRRSAWRSIELWDEPASVRLPVGVQLDLGATAKALAADRAVRAVHRASQIGALVALGGDVATCGPPPEGGWSIRVTDDHRDGTALSGQTISISSGGLATSSVVPRRWRHLGRTMHHILDPSTGQPVSARWRTVSVAAASCADANIASTAAIVLGERAAGWLARQQLPARLVTLDGIAHCLSGWPK